jgi:hypothetical protein
MSSPKKSVQAVPLNDYQADLLTPIEKLAIFVSDPMTKGVIYCALPIISFMFPLWLPAAILFLFWVSSQKPLMEFPGRTPFESKLIDKTDPKPGGKGYHRARGQVYLGRHRFTFKECWISWSDMMMHIYGLGATGSGKTQAIWAILCNFLAAGSGFSVGDGKGTLNFIREGQIAARRFGAEDDYFVINYASESPEVSHYTHKILSHKINPFSEGSAAQLKELLASISLTGDAKQNQFFEDGAANIIERIFPALVELRNTGLQELNMEVVGRATTLDGMLDLANTQGVSPTNKSFIIDYLKGAGFDFNAHRDGKTQNPEILKQHGQFSSHFSKAISSFAVQYRDKYMIGYGDISMKDIIRNRRLLVFTLPSLEKSGAELKMLGKILISSQKNAVSMELGDELEGTRAATIDKLSSSNTVPYALFYDEWAFYSIPDMAMLPAQIRSIKFCGGFFAQDYAGTTGAGDKDAEQIFANTRIKFFGSIEETGQTWVKFRDLIGEIRQAVNSDYKYIPGLFGGRKIVDGKKTQIIHRAAVEISEMQALTEGEFYMAMRGRLSPINFFYTGLEDLDEQAVRPFKLNRFSRIYPPSDKALADILAEESFLDILFSGNKLYTQKTSEINVLSNAILSKSGNSFTSQKEHTLFYISALSSFSQEAGQSLTFAAKATPKNSQAPSTHNVPEDMSSTDTANTRQEMLVVDPEKRLSETNPTQNSPKDLQSMVAAFAPSLETSNKPLSKDEGHIYQDIEEYGNIEEIAIYDENTAISSHSEINSRYAHLLSDKESEQIKQQTKSIMSLLGANPDSAEKSAKRIVENINDLSFYISPPKPMALPKEDIDDLVRRAEKLLDEQ